MTAICLFRVGAVLVLACLLPAWRAAPAATDFVYVGGYTDWELFGPPRRNPPGERSRGISVFRFERETGRLTPLGTYLAALVLLDSLSLR